VTTYAVPGYPHLRTTRPQGTAAQLGQGRIDIQDVSPALLRALDQVGAMLHSFVDIFSGYRTPAYSASVGGFAGDPHSRHVAVDATVGGKPLGAALSAAQWGSLGVTSGNQPNFYQGKPDPTHVQLKSGDQLGAPAATSTGGNLGTFIDGVLRAIGAPLTTTNRLLLAAWASAEGTKAKFNPLATTQPAAGASNFNSVGVKNYRSFQQGVQATATTLQNGHYQGIVSALRRGDVAPNDVVNRYAREFDTWGTGAGAVSSQVHSLTSGQGSALFPGVGKWLTSLPGGDLLFGGGPGNIQGDIASGGLAGLWKLIGNLLDAHWWLRVLQLLAGGVLALAGLYLLARQIGMPSAASAAIPKPVQAAAEATA